VKVSGVFSRSRLQAGRSSSTNGDLNRFVLAGTVTLCRVHRIDAEVEVTALPARREELRERCGVMVRLTTVCGIVG
jgi:hypothetical protein